MDSGSGADELTSPLLSSNQHISMEELNAEEVSRREIASGTEFSEPAQNGINSSDESWYHNPYQIIAMISNYSTSYNVVNISLVIPILEQLHPTTTPEDAAACASSLLAGMILGQLLGGALGDSFLGRLGALKLVMILQVVASLVSAALVVHSGDIYLKLAICRFILGIGAGGVYPLAAVLSAEQGQKTSSSAAPVNSGSNDDSSQIHRVVLTFSTQGLGFVTVPLIGVVLLHVVNDLGTVWRLLLGLGSVPGIILLVLQWHLDHKRYRGEAVPMEEPSESSPEIRRATELLQEFDSLEVENQEDTENDNFVQEEQTEIIASTTAGWWDSLLKEPGLVRKVIGTAGTWCLFDILFYGNTLFQPIVVEAAFGEAKSESPIHILQKTALDSLILTSIALPGYALAGAIVGKRTWCVTQTPRYVMLQGFAAMGLLYFSIGINWKYLRHYPPVLVTMYGLTFFFANYGPNTSTFILPSLVYSPECRTTWNGISAASGKLGALLGATLFEPAAEKWGDAHVMLICSGVSFLAFIVALFFVPGARSRPSQGEAPRDEESRLTGREFS